MENMTGDEMTMERRGGGGHEWVDIYMGGEGQQVVPRRESRSAVRAIKLESRHTS